MLQIKDLNFDIGDKPFFKNLSFSLERGRLHFLKGKNGAGKTTLFRALTEQILPQEKIRHVAQDVQKMIAGQFTFEENLKFAAFGLRPSFWRRPDASVFVPSFIEEFGIGLQTPVHLLSGGQKQILSLLMALQKPATLLLLDEPTAALDTANSYLVMAFLRQLSEREGMTLFVICHDDDLMEQYVTGRVMTLSLGRVF